MVAQFVVTYERWIGSLSRVDIPCLGCALRKFEDSTEVRSILQPGSALGRQCAAGCIRRGMHPQAKVLIAADEHVATSQLCIAIKLVPRTAILTGAGL